MRYLQVIEAVDIDRARAEYLKLLERRGSCVPPDLALYIEQVHRPYAIEGSWLCYLAHPVPQAA